MIHLSDIIYGSVLNGGNEKYPLTIKGRDGDLIEVSMICYSEGIPDLRPTKIRIDDLKLCNPVLFHKVQKFIKFDNYSFIKDELLKKGYTLMTQNNNQRTVFFNGEAHQTFNEVHLFQKFVFDITGNYLEVSL